MIGGFEFELDGAPSPDDIGRILRLVRAEWPNCVLESADGRLTATIPAALRNRSTTSQFFLYRDSASKQSWDEHGLAEENGEAMISVIVDDDFVMVIANEETSSSGHLAQEVLRGVRTCRDLNRLVHPFYTRQPQQATT